MASQGKSAQKHNTPNATAVSQSTAHRAKAKVFSRTMVSHAQVSGEQTVTDHVTSNVNPHDTLRIHNSNANFSSDMFDAGLETKAYVLDTRTC